MTPHVLFVFLLSGVTIFILGTTGLRRLERFQKNHAFKDTWLWTSYQFTGGFICIGAIGWYLWSLLPQAPM